MSYLIFIWSQFLKVQLYHTYLRILFVSVIRTVAWKLPSQICANCEAPVKLNIVTFLYLKIGTVYTLLSRLLRIMITSFLLLRSVLCSNFITNILIKLADTPGYYFSLPNKINTNSPYNIHSWCLHYEAV